MKATICALVGICALPGCHPRAPVQRAVPLLEDEGEVLLYLEPLPAEAARLEFSVTSAAAISTAGGVVPLEIVDGHVTSAPPPRQRLLARGRLRAGRYDAFLVGIGRATLARGEETADLLVPGEPTRLEGSFTVSPRGATVLWASLEPSAWRTGRYGFAPALSIRPPPVPVPDLVGYCTNGATNDLAVFDRVRQRVLDVIPTGRAPQGIALDATSTRAYVAAEEEGEVQVVDVAAGRIVGRVRLDPGDAPRDVALTPDGRLLVVVNHRSSTAVFADPVSWVELSRVPLGDAPTSIVMDRAGQRAYVLNPSSRSITILDLANRAVVATVATESEPVRAALDRDGTTLYVTQRGSQFLAAFSVPDLAPRGRIFVGLGATGIEIDPRTGRIYVGAGTQPRIDVLDPAGAMPVGAIDLPGPASELALLETEHLLLVLMPADRAVAVVDLTTGRTLSVFDVGGAPYELAVSGVLP